jgi:hypothetical protein
MLPGFAGEFAREDALVPLRDCFHLAAKPSVRPSLPLAFSDGLTRGYLPHVLLVSIRRDQSSGSTKEAIAVGRNSPAKVSNRDWVAIYRWADVFVAVVRPIFWSSTAA